MPSGPPAPCLTCAHLSDMTGGTWRCPAYPEGIPERFVLGTPHSTRQADQEGTLVWAPAPWVESTAR